MKKILFATTALVATAGVAAADVTFGGYARWGMEYNDARATEKTRIESRFRLIVTATTETDSGLTFGAQTRLQMDESESSYGFNSGFNSVRFWVATGGLEVSMGHVQGAFENMPGAYAGSVGLTGLGYANYVTNYGNDFYTSGANGRQGVDIKYSAGAFSAWLSHSFAQTTYGVNGATERTALFLAYSAGNYNVALFGQDSNVATDNNWALTASGVFGPATVTLQVADNTTANNMKYGVALDYQVGSATSIAAYVNHDEGLNGATGGENYGLGVVHNLGGGASIRGGVASLNDVTRADLGVQFSF